MEIPEISMISDFQAGIRSLQIQNPSTVGRFFALSGIERVPQIYRFWKWGAVILAILATFSSLIRRLKLFLISNFRPVTPSVEQLVQHFTEDFEFSDDDDDCSSVSSMEDYKEEDAESTTSYDDDRWRFDQDFRVAGADFYVNERWQNGNNLRLRRKLPGGQRFSWSEFSTGKSVVKLWDSLESLNLGFDFEDFNENVVSMWDLNENQKIRDFPVMVEPPWTVVLSTVANGGGESVVFGTYDARMREKPVICAEWDLPVGAGNGVKKVSVGDEVTGVLKFGDIRNFKTPIKTVRVTEPGGDTWWGANTVNFESF